MSSRDPSDLEVGELRVLLLQDVSHVIDQVQPKGIFGGDFLQQSTAGDPSPGQGHPGDPGDSLGGIGGGQHQPWPRLPLGRGMGRGWRDRQRIVCNLIENSLKFKLRQVLQLGRASPGHWHRLEVIPVEKELRDNEVSLLSRMSWGSPGRAFPSGQGVIQPEGVQLQDHQDRRDKELQLSGTQMRDLEHLIPDDHGAGQRGDLSPKYPRATWEDASRLCSMRLSHRMRGTGRN